MRERCRAAVKIGIYRVPRQLVTRTLGLCAYFFICETGYDKSDLPYTSFFQGYTAASYVG